MKNLEKICLLIIRWGSYLILFLPLLVYRKTLYPYIFTKIIVFQILVEIIFACWLVLVIYNKNYRPNGKNPLVIFSTLFVFILFLTALTGVDFNRSFFSTQERMTGVLTIIHFWLWFLILSSTFKNWQDWKKFIIVSAMASFLVGLYGLGQRIGLKFLLKEVEGQRMASTLGNPIYLGVYSMLHIFLLSFLLLLEKKWFWRIIWILGTIFNLIIMLLTGTRGVMVAFGFSFLIFLLILAFLKQTKKIWLPITICFIIILVFGTIFLQKQKNKPWFYKAPLFIKRIAYLTESLPQRTLAWQAGWQGFKERPIFGWGWENFNLIFNKYYQPYYLRFGEEGTWFDRSHNQIIDLLALTGLLGTLAYLFFYGSIFFLIFKKIREIKKQKESKEIMALLILGLMFLAYFLQNLTVFDTPAPLIVFYFSLALCYFVSQTDSKLQMHPNEQNFQVGTFRFQKSKTNEHYFEAKFPLPLLIFLIFIFLFFTIYKFNLEPFSQSRSAIKAIVISRIDFKEGLNWFKKALNKPVFTNPEVRLQLASLVDFWQKNLPSHLFKEGLNFAISEMEKNTKEHPLDVRYWLYLGQLYNLGFNDNEIYAQKAEEALEQALKLSPKRQEIYFNLSQTKVFLKKYQEAINLMEKAVILDDQIAKSHFKLGLIYLIGQKLEPGLKEIDKAQSLGYPVFSDPEINLFLAKNYLKDKQYDRAIEFIDASIKAQPDNLEYLCQKIIIYDQANNQEMVQKLLKELKNKNLDLAIELENYLKTLK